MGLTITIGLYVERDREIGSFVDLWRRLGGRIVEAIEFRGGKEVQFSTAPADSKILKALERRLELTESLDEAWLAKELGRVAAGPDLLRVELDVSVALFDLYLDMKFFGREHAGGETRKRVGPGELDTNDLAMIQQKIARRIGSNEHIFPALELLRFACSWGSATKPFTHAVLHPEAGWSIFNAWATYHASIGQLSSVFMWLYLGAYCGMAIPEAIEFLKQGRQLPSPAALSTEVRYVARYFPKGGDLKEFLQSYSLERAHALAQIPPEELWLTLCDVTRGDPGWHLERFNDEVFIGNDTGSRLWELYVEAARRFDS